MNQDFRDILSALSAADARFLVVGAYAVSVHAEPRATGDLDIILTSITGVTFAEAWAERVEAHYGDVPFPVIGREALLRNKLALARPKDLVDVDLIRARGK